MSAVEPLHLTPLNDTAGVSLAGGPINRGNGTDPDLILVLSWMGAKEPHIAKYTSQYHMRYPNARIVLVRCPVKHIFLTRPLAKDLAPVVDILQEELAHDTPTKAHPPRVLIHLFSNGGVHAMRVLLETLRKKQGGTVPQLPSYTLLLDSCPGYYEPSSTVAAVAEALPRWVRPLLHLLILMYRVVFVWILRREPLQNRNAAALVGPALRSAEAARTYLYSTGDRLVEWRDVEDHAGRAEQAGFVVRREKFEGAEHVSLARTEPERYWKIVEEAWASSQVA